MYKQVDGVRLNRTRGNCSYGVLQLTLIVCWLAVGGYPV